MINDELQSMMVRVTGWRQQGDGAPEKFVVERSQERKGKEGKEIQNSLMFTLGDRINERSSKQGGVSVDKVDDILCTHLPVKRRHLIFGQARNASTPLNEHGAYGLEVCGQWAKGNRQ